MFFFASARPRNEGWKRCYTIRDSCWTHILSDRDVFCTLRGGGKTAGSNAPGAFLVTPPSGRGLVTPIFSYPAVRTGSSKTHFFSLIIILLFFRGHLPQTPGFRSASQLLAMSFATRARTCILSDLNKFYTQRGGRTTAGSNAPGAFLFFWWSLAPDLRSVKTILPGNLHSFSVYSPEFS